MFLGFFLLSFFLSYTYTLNRFLIVIEFGGNRYIERPKKQQQPTACILLSWILETKEKK